MMDINNNHETQERPEIPYLRLAKQVALQKKYRKHQLNVVPPGRDYFIAHIPLVPWEFEELRFKYNDIIQELTYREAMAWCRGFGYSYTTYLMRRYHHRNPKMEEVILTCGWYDAGKPVERKNRHSVAAFEQLLEGFKTLREQSPGNSALGSSTSPGAEYPL